MASNLSRLSPARETSYLAFPYRGDSMHGTFRWGDILFVHPLDWRAVRRGDVIAFRILKPNGASIMVVHRVQLRTPTGVITRGDSCSTPDRALVHPEGVVGRVYSVQRKGRTRPVCGGRAGQLWVTFLRLRRRIVRIARWPYRLLKTSGLLPRLWQPQIVQIHLATARGPLVKYLHGRQTVACWWPEEGRFWCRKPYDLIIESPVADH